MTKPSSSPRGEHAPRAGVTWQTELARTEQLVDDDAPDPRPDRKTRRALARAARRNKPMADHGCTIGGDPAMPILISEHTQLVGRLTEAEAELARLREDLAEEQTISAARKRVLDRRRPELERAEAALARIVALAARKGVISIDAIRNELAIRCANCGREIENRGDPDMGGNHEIRWVHVPGGHTICHPQQAGSPRAEPKDRT